MVDNYGKPGISSSITKYLVMTDHPVQPGESGGKHVPVVLVKMLSAAIRRGDYGILSALATSQDSESGHLTESVRDE